MSNLLELLKDVEVEWRELGEVCEIKRGTRITKKELIYSGYPVVSGGNGYMGFTDKYNREKNTITIAQYGTAGLVKLQTEKFWANDVCFSVYPSNKVKNKYLYYFLINKQDYLYNISNRTAVPYSISKEKILKIKIPIPPLEIQGKIVKTLDKFTNYVTELTAELTAELTGRTKQYDYYRNLLLSEAYLEKLINHSEEILKLNLENIVKIKNGKDWKKLNIGNIPVYGSGGIMTYVDEYSYNKPTVLIPRKGTISNIFYLEEPFWNVDTIFYTEINENIILPKYFYYTIKNFDLLSLSINSTRPSLTQQLLNQLQINIPPLHIQQIIVNKLDKFDELINDLKVGLPKEIELRQKQYEYYRSKLLNFKED